MITIFYFAVILTLIAGFSSSLGGLISFSVKGPNLKVFSILLGFSIGVMLYISFVELIHRSIGICGILIASIFFVVGIGVMYLFDFSISRKNNLKKSFIDGKIEKSDININKTSILIILGVFTHKILEGMIIYIGLLHDYRLGLLLTFAISLHNIPEGIAVSIPTYVSTKSKKKAFLCAFITGISELLGTLIIGFVLYPFVNEFFLGAMLSIVAGIMIYIAIGELLPVSQRFGNEHLSIVGILTGIVIIALSLTFFQ